MATFQSGTRISWNQGRIVGPKPLLKLKHIWAIRTRLQHDGRVRDLAMFNSAIDSKLRGCDIVKLRVRGRAPSKASGPLSAASSGTPTQPNAQLLQRGRVRAGLS